MSNFSKQFSEEVILPDGTVASSVADVDRYLKKTGQALTSDYSTEYIKNIHFKQEQNRRNSLFADFLYNYKRIIWNE
ncbi:MAG: hypothetical protein IJ525_04380 [Alphaproteobacteria bacterium]|nr:hypothetical protein [Alphaproteobacteria bacterium]